MSRVVIAPCARADGVELVAASAERSLAPAKIVAGFDFDVQCDSTQPKERLQLTMSPVGLSMQLRERRERRG